MAGGGGGTGKPEIDPLNSQSESGESNPTSCSWTSICMLWHRVHPPNLKTFLTPRAMNEEQCSRGHRVSFLQVSDMSGAGEYYITLSVIRCLVTTAVTGLHGESQLWFEKLLCRVWGLSQNSRLCASLFCRHLQRWQKWCKYRFEGCQ